MTRSRRTIVVALFACFVLTSLGAEAALAKKFGLGDSVMRGAQNELQSRNFKVDTTVSRQFSDAPSIIRSLKRRGKLPRTVVIHLGNNGFVEAADCKRAVRAAGNRRVFLVTVKVPRSWRIKNNQRLRACARRHDARIIDWYGYSHSHDAWFYSDGFHLTPTGQRKYARLLGRET
jgi:hypothetical protein